jgi:hypothetical protein
MSSTRQTQRAAILRLLIDARGGWVPLPKIMACAAQYNARIFELHRTGLKIENKTEDIDGVKHSWFRLISIAESIKQHDWYENSTGRPRPTAQQPDLGPLFSSAWRD